MAASKAVSIPEGLQVADEDGPFERFRRLLLGQRMQKLEEQLAQAEVQRSADALRIAELEAAVVRKVQDCRLWEQRNIEILKCRDTLEGQVAELQGVKAALESKLAEVRKRASEPSKN